MCRDIWWAVHQTTCLENQRLPHGRVKRSRYDPTRGITTIEFCDGQQITVHN